MFSRECIKHFGVVFCSPFVIFIDTKCGVYTTLFSVGLITKQILILRQFVIGIHNYITELKIFDRQASAIEFHQKR
jgi:hypothetical protein